MSSVTPKIVREARLLGAIRAGSGHERPDVWGARTDRSWRRGPAIGVVVAASPADARQHHRRPQPAVPDAGRPFAPVFEGVVQRRPAPDRQLQPARSGRLAGAAEADVDRDDTVSASTSPPTTGCAPTTPARPTSTCRRRAGDRRPSLRRDVARPQRRPGARCARRPRLGAAPARRHAVHRPPRRRSCTRPSAAPGGSRAAPRGLGRDRLRRGRRRRHYTVADIVSQRAGPYRRTPRGRWSSPTSSIPRRSRRVADRDPLRPRSLSWHDGFQLVEGGTVDVPSPASRPPPGRRRSARASTSSPAAAGRSDNLLFAGEPLGNNNSPGDSPPPGGVASAPIRRATR